MVEIRYACKSDSPRKNKELKLVKPTVPIYRCWTTMRLASIEGWRRSWAMPEMSAGMPEMGAVDAWREALTTIETLKLDGAAYCG